MPVRPHGTFTGLLLYAYNLRSAGPVYLPKQFPTPASLANVPEYNTCTHAGKCVQVGNILKTTFCFNDQSQFLLRFHKDTSR